MPYTRKFDWLAKATTYLKQGTTRAIATSDTLQMILGIFENRLDVLDSGKEKKIPAQSVAPSTPTTGDKYVDTSVTPNVLKRWDGTAWQTIGGSGSTVTVDSALSTTSTNPVQNKVVTGELAQRVKTILQGGTTYSPDANGQLSLPTPATPVTSWQTLTGDGSKTVFTLTGTNVAVIAIFGPYGRKETAYTVSGATLTFSAAPAAGDVYEVLTGTLASVSGSSKLSKFTYGASSSFDVGTAITELSRVEVANNSGTGSYIPMADATYAGATVTVTSALQAGDIIFISWK